MVLLFFSFELFIFIRCSRLFFACVELREGVRDGKGSFGSEYVCVTVML